MIARYYQPMYHAEVRYITLLLLCFFLLPELVFADRQPVLKQIDLPHSYYYREMYLPQLTTGPSSVTWSPDSTQVLYSMQGSLWRQRIDSTSAEQLTDGPGYDYQPDWSPDGRLVVFSRYNKDAVELCLLDLQTKDIQPITNGGAVNVEPRWSPDGKQIAFVSTAGTGHLHIFSIAIVQGKAGETRQLTQEHKSDLPRYYYSAFDHEISPTWSPDGSELIYISNKGHIHGTGGFWRMKVGGEGREIRYEETTWKARPDWSPDGKRVIYSSYLGRQWNQLWIMTADGGDPFPLSYGEFDITAPRWSHDGSMIAFISNENGNTSLWIQKAVGGERKQVIAKDRKYMHPAGRLTVVTLDGQGKQVAARVSITAEDGRAYAPEDAWMHADDSFDRSERPFEAHYFHTSGKSTVTVPAGKISIDVMNGFDHGFEQRTVDVATNDNKVVNVHLKRLQLPADWKNWVSNDLHVHMNYTGTYRNTPEHLLQQAAAENLNVIHNLIVNKEQRIPDIPYYTPKPLTAPGRLVLESQEFHTSFWGHLGLLGLQDHFLIPGYAAYPNTPAASLYPTNAAVADLAHAQHGLAGYVHPFDPPEPDPFKDAAMSERELPADVALGKIDYYEVVGFSDHKTSAAVWYRMLNCGFHIPTGSGTDAMANFASLRGPVGLNRVYINSHGSMKREDILDALKNGHTFATNGPLLFFTVNGKEIGGELSLPKGPATLNFQASLRSIIAVDHLQLIYNGKVVKDIDLKGDHKTADESGSVTVEKSGWLVLRAWSEKAAYPILDLYPYATTSPIYISIGNQPVRSPEDARYFVAWLDRVIQEATNHKGYNTDLEKEQTLKVLTDARAIYAKQQ